MGGMTMLLDTHIFLWWLFDDPRLPEGIRLFVKNPDHTVYVSAVSVWEIATKYRIGKLPEAGTIAKNVPEWIERAGFQSMPVTAEHAQLAGGWDIAHRDPFDRMLAAQARIEKVPLATVDNLLKGFSINIVDGL